MRISKICESCGEQFLSHHGEFCDDCAAPNLKARRIGGAVRKLANERNLESKKRERGKHRHRQMRIA